jgi:peptidoglycan/LPS O-acetylase OafA/YrhL
LSETRSRVESLDVLRTLAILLVFLSHYGIYASDTVFRPVGQYGWAGVDLFFVLSGYLIASQLLKPVTEGRLPSYREFYLRRALRILPSYFAVLVLYWVFPHWREREVMASAWRFLTFTANFGLDFRRGGAFSHAWSLCVEEHFYLLLPLLVIALARPRTRGLTIPVMAGVFVAGFLARLGSWIHFMGPLTREAPHGEWAVTFFKRIYYPSYNRLDGLLVGVMIASARRLRPELWQRLTRRGDAISVAGLLLLAAACWVCAEESSLGTALVGFPLIAAGFGCLVIAALSPRSRMSRIRIPGAPTMALLAFTFYLTHKEVIHLAHRRALAQGWNPDGLPVFFGTFAASLALSALLHVAVERPFLSLRDRLIENADRIPPGPSGSYVASSRAIALTIPSSVSSGDR